MQCNKLNKHALCLLSLLILFFVFHWSIHEAAAEDRVSPFRKGNNVAGSDHLRRLIDKHIYKREGKRQSRIMRFLFHGDTGTDSPLEEFAVLDRPAIATIARHAKTLHGHSQEVDFDYWERKVDFYTYFNHTGDNGEFDPINPYAPFLVNQTLEKYQQKLGGMRSLGNNIDARRHSKIMSRDEGTYFAGQRHPTYAKIFIDLMLQAIYNSRLQIHKTKLLRSRFRFDINYRIALLYSQCTTYVAKLKALHATASNLLETLHFNVKFLHFLVIYEKALAAHTDVTACVFRIDAERRWMLKWYRARMDPRHRVHGSNFSLIKAKVKVVTASVTLSPPG